MHPLLRIGLYILFILAGLLLLVMTFLSAGFGMGHGGPSKAPIGLYLMGGIAAILTALYAIFRGLGKADVSSSGASTIRFATIDLVVLGVLWAACLAFGAAI